MQTKQLQEKNQRIWIYAFNTSDVKKNICYLLFLEIWNDFESIHLKIVMNRSYLLISQDDKERMSRHCGH